MTRDPVNQPARLTTAAELATRLGVSRAYVYEHAERLGAIRLGCGPRARLRFDPHEVMSRLLVGATSEDPTAQNRTAVRTRTGRPSPDTTRDSPLLPIKTASVQ